MNHPLVVVLVLCTLSMVLCQTEQDSDDFTRCRSPPWPQECKDFGKVFWEKKKSMLQTKEIGSCPHPKSCEDCKKEDDAKVMTQLGREPTEECKALFEEHKARKG